MRAVIPKFPPPRSSIYQPVGESTSFDQRLAGWHEERAAHERGVRRKLLYTAPIILFLFALLMYALVGV